MNTHSRAHWRIFKDAASDPLLPWHYEHDNAAGDSHFTAPVHDCGAVKTFHEAVRVVNTLSWHECGLALDQVPFYGLELGINTPDGARTCALDVAGFRHLEEATAYAETLRDLSAEDASTRAERDGYMVSPMDADDEDLHLPIVGATVYLYDDETVWSHDLASWEEPLMRNILEAPASAGHAVPDRGPIYDRRTVLTQLADGARPEPVFGPSREAAGRELAGYLRGIRLDDNERLRSALAPTHMLERRRLAYRAGVRFLHEAYYEYGLVTGPHGDLR